MQQQGKGQEGERLPGKTRSEYDAAAPLLSRFRPSFLLDLPRYQPNPARIPYPFFRFSPSCLLLAATIIVAASNILAESSRQG